MFQTMQHIVNTRRKDTNNMGDLIPSNFKVTIDMTPGAMMFLGAAIVFIVFTAK